MLRESGAQKGALVCGGGQKAREFHHPLWALLLERGAQACWVAEVWKELQAEVDQLSEAGFEERPAVGC